MKNVMRVGVYGVSLENNKMLLIIQKSGPFQNKFDFPGGGVEFAETIEDALRREFQEEVSCTFKSCNLLYNLTSTIDVLLEKEESYSFYQIGMIYKIIELHTILEESDYIRHFVDVSLLTKENTSPLLWQYIQITASQKN